MSQINTELGTNVNSLGHAWVRLLANKPTTGSLKYSDLYSRTARFDGAITISSSNQSVGFNMSFFGATSNTLLRNAINGNVEIDFNTAPNWPGNIYILNNTTGTGAVCTKQNAQSWQGSPNPLRTSTADSFTIRPI
jgi:hypothetical protein